MSDITLAGRQWWTPPATTTPASHTHVWGLSYGPVSGWYYRCPCGATKAVTGAV